MAVWYLIIGLIISLLALLVCVVNSSDYGSVGWILGDMLAGLAALGFVLVLIIVPINKHVDMSNCHKFGINTSRTTKFVNYNWFQWDCLTHTSTGRWIPIDQLREFGK